MARHPFDVLSFVFGLLFAAFGLLLLGGDAVRASVALPWAGPIAAIGLGLILVVAARPRREPLAASGAIGASGAISAAGPDDAPSPPLGDIEA